MCVYKRIVVLVASVLSVLSCTPQVEQDSIKKKVALPEVAGPTRVLNAAFLIVDGVYNSELVAPMDIFHHTVYHTDPGMRVFTVAPDSLPITTFEGLKIIPDYAFLYDLLPTIDILVVPSAEQSMDRDLENEELINFVQKTGQNAQYVMSLCDGAFVLAKAGLVDGKESTTFPSDIERYKTTFPELAVHSDVSFVHDGKLITSVGGAKSYDPALYLSELLYGNKAAKGLAKGLVIDWELSSIDFVIAGD